MNNFQHQHTAHCESGVMSTMLKAQGVDFNEAMVFGLASALTFVYIPLVKVNGMPLISYRMPPKSIIKNVAKRLKVRLKITALFLYLPLAKKRKINKMNVHSFLIIYLK